MNTEYINKILEIGKRETCTDQELSYFLQNLPDTANKELLQYLRSEYSIGTWHWRRSDILAVDIPQTAHIFENDSQKNVSFIVDLIKGIHLIMFKAGYGRASTTTICNLLGTVMEKDKEKFIDLYNWIVMIGGNYYIEPNITFNDAKKAEEEHKKFVEEERLRMENMHAEAVAKKQSIRDLHTKVYNETQRLYKKCKEKLQKMSDEQLIEAFNKDVGNAGRVGVRARFHAALHEEFEKCGFDFLAIGKKNGLSFTNKIKLVGKKIIKL